LVSAVLLGDEVKKKPLVFVSIVFRIGKKGKKYREYEKTITQKLSVFLRGLPESEKMVELGIQAGIVKLCDFYKIGTDK